MRTGRLKFAIDEIQIRASTPMTSAEIAAEVSVKEGEAVTADEVLAALMRFKGEMGWTERPGGGWVKGTKVGDVTRPPDPFDP